MKKGFLLGFCNIFLGFCSNTIFAQTNPPLVNGKITGKIRDSITKIPVEYATISLYKKGNKSPLNGTASDHSGNFSLDKVSNTGEYVLKIDFIGYLSKTIDSVFINAENPIFRTGIIFLSPRSKNIKEIVVKGQRELIENRIDKMVYNAENDVTSQIGVAIDLLKKVPQISVNIDGNVELAGSSSIRFLINGKPSSAFGSNISDVLQSIPASQIKSIEVITNPSAKYDGQGLGGIINIILKKNKAEGINGNVSLTAGTLNENGSFNLGVKRGNFGLNAFLSANARLENTAQNSSDQIKLIDSGTNIYSLHQQGPSRIWRNGLQSGIGFDWSLDTLNTLSGEFNYDLFRRYNSGEISQTSEISPINSLSQILSSQQNQNNTSNQSSSGSFDGSLNFKKEFNKKDQELEFGINTSYENSISHAQNELLLYPLLIPKKPYQGDSTYNPANNLEAQFSVDYSQPFSKDKLLGFGAKVSLRSVRSDIYSNRFDTLKMEYLTDPSSSYNLKYQQQVFAIYSEFALPIAHAFDLKFGLRYERTNLSTQFSNAPGAKSPPGYNTFLPSIFISKKFENDQVLKFGYSKRIEPPDFRDLNPFVNITDPNNFTRGNPYLLPEIANRLELNYNKTFQQAGSINITLFYRTSNHDIQPYLRVDSSITVRNIVYKNQSVTTIENIGLEEDAGFNFFSNLHIGPKLDFRTNTSLFHRYTINAIDAGLNARSVNYRVNVNLSYTISKGFITEFSGNFNSARNEVQGRYPSFTTYSIAIRKPILKGKGSLALVANNFLSEYYNLPTSLSGTDFNINSNRKILLRSFGLNFTWKFGKLKFKKEKDNKRAGYEGTPEVVQ